MEPVGARTSRARPRDGRRRAERGTFLPAHVPARVRGSRRDASDRLRRPGPRRLRRPAARGGVNTTLLQRAVWLAGITLVAAIAAVAITRRDASGNQSLPGAVVV